MKLIAYFSSLILFISIAAAQGAAAIDVARPAPVQASAIAESHGIGHSPSSYLEGDASVSPVETFKGETITITLRGFRPNAKIMPGYVRLEDIWLRVPGYFNVPGAKPWSGPDGTVSFDTQVPREAPDGPQTITVDWGPSDQRTTPFTVLTGSLTVTPQTTVANQTVIIRAAGMTPSTVPGGNGPRGVHQILGDAQSFVSLDGMRLGSTYVTYPIDLDNDGTLYATMILPMVPATMSGNDLEVMVTDTNGTTGTGSLDIQSRSLSVSPVLSPPGSTVTLTGRGFIASNDAPTGDFSVDITYDGAWHSTVVPDGSGGFIGQMTIPNNSPGGFPKTIEATIQADLGSASVAHDIPPRSITMDPAGGPPGTVVTIAGVSFPAFAQMTSITLDRRPVMAAPSPTTDRGGGFSTPITIPEMVNGLYFVVVEVRGIRQFARFQVADRVIAGSSAAVSTGASGAPETALLALSASSEAPARTPAATALAPLADNLIRVWLLDPATDRWEYYDPASRFTQSFNLTEFIPGRLYLIKMFDEQTVTLNGWERRLYPGWNRVHW